MALILTACFSGGILTSVVFREQKNINNFEEMLDSNLTVITHNNSWVWSEFDSVIHWNKQLDEQMMKLRPRLNFFPRSFLYDDVN